MRGALPYSKRKLRKSKARESPPLTILNRARKRIKGSSHFLDPGGLESGVGSRFPSFLPALPITHSAGVGEGHFILSRIAILATLLVGSLPHGPPHSQIPHGHGINFILCGRQLVNGRATSHLTLLFPPALNKFVGTRPLGLWGFCWFYFRFYWCSISGV